MTNDAYAKIVDGVVVDVVMATEKDTADFFLGQDCVLIEDWAEIGWTYNQVENTFSAPVITE